MKSLIAFARVLIGEAGERCGISTIRDLKTVTDRYEHEGSSFLTISLSDFGKGFQKSLAHGRVDPTYFPGFASSGSSGLPRFLGGFLGLVFDQRSGCLLDNPSHEAISCIRQITLAFGKVEADCTDERVAKAYRAYVECEKDVRRFDGTFPSMQMDFQRVAKLAFGSVLSILDRQVRDFEIMPRHSSGSTADRLSGNAKWDNREWTTRLDSVFPVMEYLVPTFRHIEVLDQTNILEPGDERPVRVITVPKTLKTPRLIAMEPTCMMFMQQGLHVSLKKEIDRDDILSSLISWESQLPNQQLARRGSIDGSLATLDLREASDRVSNQHVRALLAGFTHLSEAVDATRSRKADVPGHGVLRLAKFASMGSALCFPFESMVFLTIVLLGIEDELRHPLSRKDIMSLAGKVRIYGDDILVPVDMVHSVMKRLASFGMQVNTDKSFWTGKFRESCGGDYYDGTDVTPVRVRSVIPTSHLQTDAIVSTVSLRNQLFHKSWPRCVEYLDNILGDLLPLYVDVPVTSSALGRHTYEPIWAQRMHDDLQIPLIKASVLRHKPTPSSVTGYGALLKFLYTDTASRQYWDKDHLRFAGRARSSRIKTSWVSAR